METRSGSNRAAGINPAARAERHARPTLEAIEARQLWSAPRVRSKRADSRNPPKPEAQSRARQGALIHPTHSIGP